MIVTIFHYFGLAYAPLFLFAAIKLQKSERTTGRTMLVWGFAFLTAIFVQSVAHYLEVFVINYAPWYDLHQDAYGTHEKFEPWERWFYWGKSILQWSGTFLVALGFFKEARSLTNHSVPRNHHPMT